MRAVISAQGNGARLGGPSLGPKCLRELAPGVTVLDCIVEPLLKAGVEVHIVPRPGGKAIRDWCDASWRPDQVVVQELPLEPYAATVVAAARGYAGPVIAVDSDVLLPGPALTRFAEAASVIKDESILGISADPLFTHPKTLWVSDTRRPRMWPGPASEGAWRSASVYAFSPADMARMHEYAQTGMSRFSPFLIGCADTATFFRFDFAININTSDDLQEARRRFADQRLLSEEVGTLPSSAAILP